MNKLPKRVYLTPAQAIVWSTLTPLGPHEYEHVGHCRECKYWRHHPARAPSLVDWSECLASVLGVKSVPADGSGFCHEFESATNGSK